jgi:transmembrane sensor
MKFERHLRQTSPERIERGWRAIAPHLRHRVAPEGRRMYAIAAFAVLLVVALVFGPKPWSKTPTTEGTVIETDEGQTQTVILAEGSRVVLGPSSRLALVNVSADRVRLRLDRGVIDVEATHRAGRTFTITAKQLDIDVVGTRFHVDVGDASGNADVTVTEGRVRVTSQDDLQHPRYLGAGETWSTRGAALMSTASAPAVAIASTDAGVPHLAPPRPRLSPKFLGLYHDGRYNDAYALVADEFAARCAVLDADGLFTLAETARLSGHPREAATAYDALRTRFRTDKRAPVAALELGRIHLDLDEPRAAKAALDDAIALKLDPNLREVADARRIQALEEIGDRAECAEARDLYLGAYPQGSHRASVARRCR